MMDCRDRQVEPSEGGNAGRAVAGLHDVPDFGSNPGNLRMNLFVPHRTRGRRPLVVVLHGCTQAVATYDRAAGWTRLAAASDFLVLMPAQVQANNQSTCFSWFEPGDTRRDAGEALSIRQMIDCAVSDHDVDPARIFICGLSAGGAMACAMLATYPEVFAGGTILAGLPYGTATSVGEAFDSMRNGRIKEAKAWGDFVRKASLHAGPWPSISIWHGTADEVVKPINAGELVKQWTNVHEVAANAPAEDQVGSATRRIWHDVAGRACVTQYSVPGLRHGVPVEDRDPPAPFFLPAGLASTQIIARDWGLDKSARDEGGHHEADPAKSVVGFLSTLWR